MLIYADLYAENLQIYADLPQKVMVKQKEST